jgi:hypothetical protein
MQLTARIAVRCLGHHCCRCSWQSIDNRPKQLVIMVWHSWRDLMLRVFGNAFVEDKTIGWQCHIAGQQQLGFSVRFTPCQLLLYCSLCIISSGTNLAPENHQTVWASGTLQGAQVTVAHCPVTNRVDCLEVFYSFTNQAFVSWCLGACQEW